MSGITIKINFPELPEPDIDYNYKKRKEKLNEIYGNTRYDIDGKQHND